MGRFSRYVDGHEARERVDVVEPEAVEPAETRTCKDCLASFEFEERRFFDRMGWPPPVRCTGCRALAKARREAR